LTAIQAPLKNGNKSQKAMKRQATYAESPDKIMLSFLPDIPMRAPTNRTLVPHYREEHTSSYKIQQVLCGCRKPRQLRRGKDLPNAEVSTPERERINGN
jgi:hypothetical protein